MTKKPIGGVGLIHLTHEASVMPQNNPTHEASAMLQNNSTNDTTATIVENTNVWALAQNKVYRNLQQKLNERTAKRDMFRYANQLLLP